MIYTSYSLYGDCVYMSGYVGNKKVNNIIPYKPSLYVRSNNDNTTYKCIHEKPLSKIEFNSIKELRDFKKNYSNVDNYELYGNKYLDNQYVIEYYKAVSPDYYTVKFNVCFLDIEVDVKYGGVFPDPILASYEISAITTYSTKTKKFTLFTSKEWDYTKSDSAIANLDIEHVYCDNESSLLKRFMNYFIQSEFDITSGWNSANFDMPYIVKRIENILGKEFVKVLSPFKKVIQRTDTDNYNNEVLHVDIVGIPHLDYQELFKKFYLKPIENTKLDTVSDVCVKANKIKFDGALDTLYETNPQLYYDYNVQDVNLLRLLNDKLRYIELVQEFAYDTLSNYVDALGTVKMWEKLIYKELYSDNIIAPLQNKNNKDDFVGGYVKELSRSGFYHNVITEDLNSLYPHIIMQWNIGPDTIISPNDELKELANRYINTNNFNIKVSEEDTNTLKKYNVCLSLSGDFYRTDKKSFLSNIMYKKYNERKQLKREMIKYEDLLEHGKDLDKETITEYEFYKNLYNTKQTAKKLLMNSGYGALGNANFIFFMVNLAESITKNGQFVNMYTSNSVNEFLKSKFDPDHEYWYYGDTDSAMYDLTPVVNRLYKTGDKVDFIDNFEKKIIKPKINQASDLIKNMLNCIEQKMVWEREIICATGSACHVAKKKYFMSVDDKEGVRYETPKYKVMGMEGIKSSSFPRWARDMLIESYETILKEDESLLHDLHKKHRAVFDNFKIEDIACISGVGDILKYTDPISGLPTRGAQLHMRSAIMHNHLVDKLNLKSIKKITNNSKIKYVELRQPNKLKYDVIGFVDKLPIEFGVSDRVDRDKVFNTNVGANVDLVTNILGWSKEHTISLESFF